MAEVSILDGMKRGAVGFIIGYAGIEEEGKKADLETVTDGRLPGVVETGGEAIEKETAIVVEGTIVSGKEEDETKTEESYFHPN